MGPGEGSGYGKILRLKNSTSNSFDFKNGMLIAHESEIHSLHIDNSFQFDIFHSKIQNLGTSLHDNGTVEHSTIGTIEKLKVLRNLSISNSRIDEISSLGIFVLGTLKMENVTIGKINEEGLVTVGCTIMKNVTIHTAVDYSIFGHHSSCNEFKDLTIEERTYNSINGVWGSHSSYSNVHIKKRIDNDFKIMGNLNSDVSKISRSTTTEKPNNSSSSEKATSSSLSTSSVEPMTTSPAPVTKNKLDTSSSSSTSAFESITASSVSTSSIDPLISTSGTKTSIEPVTSSSVLADSSISDNDSSAIVPAVTRSSVPDLLQSTETAFDGLDNSSIFSTTTDSKHSKVSSEVSPTLLSKQNEEKISHEDVNLIVTGFFLSALIIGVIFVVR